MSPRYGFRICPSKDRRIYGVFCRITRLFSGAAWEAILISQLHLQVQIGEDDWQPIIKGKHIPSDKGPVTIKYLSTGYRVETGDWQSVDGKEILIDDGMLEVTINGGEIIRSAQLQDYVILLVNPHTKDYTFLEMKEYDSKTGIYTVVFPYNGPFMVLQNLK